MGVSFALATPVEEDAFDPEDPEPLRFGRETVDDYYDFVADIERRYRDDGETPSSDWDRERAHERIDEHGASFVSEKIDSLGDTFRPCADRYPNRRAPAFDAPPVVGADIRLLRDQFRESLAELHRRDAGERDWKYSFRTRWLALCEYALANDLGMAKT